MAVYTELSFEQVDAFVQTLAHGPLQRVQPILAGIENSNYFISTASGEWVLTLFERLRADELPFYLQLMQHLARRGLPVPQPQADNTGRLLHELAGKPAALLNRLAGRAVLQPEAEHIGQLGRMLARLHHATADFPQRQPHARGLAWWAVTVPQVLPFVDAERAALLRDELQFQQAQAGAVARLPHGVIHADLFRDNVVFDGPAGAPTLSGMFDFFFAGVDSLLFDIAVCLNDWCIDHASGRLSDSRANTLLAAYETQRALQPAERHALPAMLRAAAYRFWLSRLWDLYLPRDASLLRAHDPMHFERVLRQHLTRPWQPGL